MRMLVLALLLLAAAPASAEEGATRGKRAGDWLVGVGAVAAMPANSGSVTPIGGRPIIADAPAAALELVWFATPHLALASIAAPSRHTASVRGSALGDVALGQVWIASPNLAIQYHPWPAARVSPYLGAGATVFLARSDGGARAPFVGGVAVSTSAGPLLNVGMDVELAPRWLLNLDARRAFVRTTASVNAGLAKANLRLDPWVIGAALRYRF